MNIIDKTQPQKKPVITLNDIPVGTIFRGTIVGHSGRLHTGIFFKAHGRSAVRHSICGPYANKTFSDVIVVKLDDLSKFKENRLANAFLSCRPVENYEALDVTLQINGVIGNWV